ncbi:hypothetical protein SDC9_142427 [bioreactor metagenome]|uniref:Uncharacterized protein n=1 Tax=bioreactor metagenome TaxID=1076179 RepID=A0A645E389_9ZZZZ
MNPASERRLIHPGKPNGIHNQIGQIIRGITARPQLSADRQVDERLIAGKIFCSQFTGEPHHFRAFDNKTAHQFKGFKLVDAARFHVRLEHWINILIQASEGDTCLIFFHNKQGFQCPNRLQGFMECFRRISRYTGQDIRDFVQFVPPGGVLFPVSQSMRIIRKTFSIGQDPVARFNLGFIKVDLIDFIGVYHG